MATAWQTPSTYTTTTQGEGCSDKHSTDTRRLGTKKGVGVGAAASASFVVSGGGGAHAPISAVDCSHCCWTCCCLQLNILLLSLFILLLLFLFPTLLLLLFASSAAAAAAATVTILLLLVVVSELAKNASICWKKTICFRPDAVKVYQKITRFQLPPLLYRDLPFVGHLPCPLD